MRIAADEPYTRRRLEGGHYWLWWVELASHDDVIPHVAIDCVVAGSERCNRWFLSVKCSALYGRVR